MKPHSAPLAESLRPQKVEDILGQEDVLSQNSLITKAIENQTPLSILLWGPPGCGKTTLARAYANAFYAYFEPMSAVFSGVADIKKAVADAKHRREGLTQQRTIVFVDEIHRFNKSQQDAFLPFVEDGTITLVGATTENPSFELNSALLSRLRVITLKSLDDTALQNLLTRAEGQVGKLPLTEDARTYLTAQAQGDGRYLLNLVENLVAAKPEEALSPEQLAKLLQKRAAQYDKSGEGHYNLISALHKSVRGSDPDAALYWLCRMLEGGEDPHFLARRLVRMAYEDIGLADPEAATICLNAWQTYQRLGSPEGELALAEACIYLALAPKSNSIYTAYKAARKKAVQTGNLNPPAHILNAPTDLMKSMGYGSGYNYDHDAEDAFSGQNYFPESMKREKFYTPVERGFERDMQKRIAYFENLRKKRKNETNE